MSFGRRVAEEEGSDLSRYFVETDFWRRLYAGDIDIIYGSKGSGKSALYSLLMARKDALFDRSIVLATAENPRGTPAFRDLAADPPTSESELANLWKLYFASVVCGVFDDYDFADRNAARLRSALEDEGLRPRGRSLQTLLRSVRDYVRRFANPEAVEAGLQIDSLTGTPAGVTGRIVFSEPSAKEAESGKISVSQLLDLADQSLIVNRFQLWILLDRLDVAFAESPELEENALRALFRVYLDFLAFEHLDLKIFLRTDIWRRITKKGFREASHITRHATISWDRRTLLYLIVARAVQNIVLQEYLRVAPEEALRSTETQESTFYRISPRQVDVGPNKPSTLDWSLTRTRDSTGQSAPRELIHLFNSLREVQIRRLEIGEPEPENEELFVRPAFKEALAEVSRTRLEQTLYAEYPGLRSKLEALRGEKTLHNADSLARIWQVDPDQASTAAHQLVEVGFLEQRGARESPEFWVPFLYREALDLVQGSADGVKAGPEDED